ncbi:MAG: hypothetical protein JW929_06665 [Anaerolineales bacterium]|nr:hypothetical protein [Anaerolineales bacterium]
MNRITGRFLLTAACLAAAGCNLQLTRATLGDSTIEALAATALKQSEEAQPGGTIQMPTPTASATLPPTPTLTPSITLTPTLEKVTIQVSRNTNCREGPDKFFDLVGVMKVGETAEAVGRNAPKTYWVIKLPADTAKTCWLWHEWATVTGNGDALPIIQSPPTPTWSPKPDFTFQYLGLTACPPHSIVRLQVTNTGNIAWESCIVKVKDTVIPDETSTGLNNFVDYSGCSPLNSVPSIGPGETGYAVGVLPSTFSGHNVEVTLHLYTQDNQAGTHMSGNFNMTAP